MLSVTNDNIEKFSRLKEKYLYQTKIPQKNNWLGLSENDIWLRFIIQILIIGSSTPAEKFNNSISLRERVSYSSLQRLETDIEKMEAIHYVLRKIGCRYVGDNIDKGWKVKSLANNFNKLQQFNGGPKGFLVLLEDLIDDNKETQAINILKKMKGFKDKSCRDFLMEYGMIDNRIALDTRLYNILVKLDVGIPTLEEIQRSSRVYNQVENGILQYICKPLGLLGIELDRMLYQNYNSIMASF